MTPARAGLQTLVLEEIDGRTRMTATSVFDTQEDRDGMWESGAQTGGRETWERFAELVQELKKR